MERVKKAEETATIVATTTMSPEKLKETKEAEIRKLQEVKNELDRAVRPNISEIKAVGSKFEFINCSD